MITRLYTPTVRRVVAVDFSLASLQLLQRNLPPELRRKVLLIHGDICALPLVRGAFDQVVAAEVLHHLPTAEMRQGGLQTAADLLKSDGAFTCSVYHWSLQKRHNARHGRTDYSLKEGRHGSNIHYYNFEAAEFRRMIAPAGLEPRVFKGIMIGLPGTGRLGVLGKWLRALVAHTPLGTPFSALLLCRSVRRPAQFTGANEQT